MLGSGIVQQLVVAEILLLSFQTCQRFGLFAIVNNLFRDIITNQVILGIGQYPVEAGYLFFEKFDDIAGLAKANLLVLTGKDLVEDVQRVIGDTCIVGRISDIYNITL